jgi:hypothetical protein
MSIAGIGGSTASGGLSVTQSKADETTEQLAAQGDPVAIAKLKQEQEQLDPSPFTGAQEPGKGEQIDRYV